MENNWTEICAKCMEGDIEPRYCEYYGEPNGCNSPTCGEHPPTPTPTPNAVAMHSCLVKILVEMTDLGGMQVGKKACFSPDAIADEIRQALAVPPRNCDRFATVKDAAIAFARERQDAPQPCPDFTFSAWLLAPAAAKSSKL